MASDRVDARQIRRKRRPLSRVIERLRPRAADPFFVTRANERAWQRSQQRRDDQ